jgi:hypothetical protein
MLTGMYSNRLTHSARADATMSRTEYRARMKI